MTVICPSVYHTFVGSRARMIDLLFRLLLFPLLFLLFPLLFLLFPLLFLFSVCLCTFLYSPEGGAHARAGGCFWTDRIATFGRGF